jgi:SEC-C motif-containing protein
MKLCPCGSGRDYSECCELYISGKADAPTAEALMRSRYTAYVVHDIDYIVDTYIKDDEHDIDVKQTRDWSEKSEWLGLTIINTEKGTPSDTEGIVEFTAEYKTAGVKDLHHEIALFKKVNDMWFYDEGNIAPIKTIVRETPKVGRNEPCPCGSGKKYKHCCGKNG